MGWTMTEGKVIKWLKKEGEKVEKGESLLEIETDKVTVEVESSGSGVLRKILAPEGSSIPVGELIAIIADPDEDISDIVVKKEMVVLPEEKKVERLEAPKEAVERIKISPLARKLAEEHKIDMKEIRGSGPGGRIVREDVLKAIETMKGRMPTEVPGKVMPLTGMRKAIAERMAHSARTTAHLTFMTEVNMSEIVKFYEKFLPENRKKIDDDITYTDILVKASAIALKEHPLLNSIFMDDKIHLLEEINIGMAVAVQEGLVVPVIHDADKKSLFEIAVTRKQLITKANKGKLSPSEATGGTFTISNLGMFGVDFFTPIINPPENAILGVGRILEKPVAINGKVEIKPMMPLSLTFDHRAIDGVPAAKFLQKLKQILENPYPLL